MQENDTKAKTEAASLNEHSAEEPALSSGAQGQQAIETASDARNETLWGPKIISAQEPDLWQARDLVLFIAFATCWAFLSGLLLLAGYAILKALMGWKTPTAALVDNTFFGLLVQVVLYGPVLLYIILLVVAHYRLPFWAGIRWRWPGGGTAVKLLFSGVLLALLVAFGSALLPDRKDFPLEKMFSSPSAAYALGAFAVLIAPFMEELIFRGVLFAFFEHLAGLRWAVAGSAVLFAALHYPEYAGAWTHLGMILLVGTVFSLARALTGSLVPSFLLHTAYNGTFMLALFVGTHHFRNLPSFLIA
jgi:uncharacterized protein